MVRKEKKDTAIRIWVCFGACFKVPIGPFVLFNLDHTLSFRPPRPAFLVHLESVGGLMTVEQLRPPQGGKTEYTLSVHVCWMQSFVLSVSKAEASRVNLEDHRVDSVVFFALSGV